MTEEQFIEIIADRKERRNLEFKQSTPWESPAWKAKIIKTILALSNIRDGGWIVIGVTDSTRDLAGMIPQHLETYSEDDLSSKVAEYADPYAKFRLNIVKAFNKRFLVITVSEFDGVPVICKREFTGELRRGAMYTRSYRKPESIEVPSQTEMREILQIAIDTGVRNYLRSQQRLGLLSSTSPRQASQKQHDDQLADLYE